MAALYLSDLDGTLLTDEQIVSPFTATTINELCRKGMLFSYATARSYITAAKVTKGISALLPAIVYNGAFIAENGTGRILASNFFESRESEKILSLLLSNKVYPIVYAFKKGRECFSYDPTLVTSGMAAFLDTRKGDIRSDPVPLSALGQGDVFYFTCIDEQEKLSPLYEKLRSDFVCVYSKDIYTKAQWLEIMPKGATKAQAALKLKKMLNCERLIVFGDGVNDLPLFEIADESYAVSNADNALKAAATAVIGSNNEDGAAHQLLKIYK